MVFDKTGTLTEEGLEVSGYRSAIKDKHNGKIHFDNFEKDLH